MSFSGSAPPLNLSKPSKDDSLISTNVNVMSQCLEMTNKSKKTLCNFTQSKLSTNTSRGNESINNSTDIKTPLNSHKDPDHDLKSGRATFGSATDGGMFVTKQQRPDGTDPDVVNSNTIIKVSAQEECPKSMDNFRTTIVGLNETDVECTGVEDKGQQTIMAPSHQQNVPGNDWVDPSLHSGENSAQMVDEMAHAAETAECKPEVPLKVLRSSKRSQSTHKCTLCNKVFKSASLLEKHNLANHDPNFSIKEIYKFNCDQCLATFQFGNQLEQHKLSHTEKVKVFQATDCTTCNEPLKTYEDHKAHVKMHSKRYQCDQCGMTFVQKSYLTIHSRSHTGEKPFKCTTCPASFKQLSHLTTHKRTHTLEKPFNCSMCPARFSQSSSMKRHMRTHTGDKPYVCQICVAAFTDKRNLTRHMMSHEGKRPFKCSMCVARFTQKIDLIRHNLSHAGVKPFKCTLCSAAFSRQNNLRWHQRTHDSDATIDHCALCGVGFSNRRDLKQHLRQHSESKPLTCKLCGTIVSCRFSLLRHMKTHNDYKPHACSMCPAAFLQRTTLKRHELRHKGIRAYKCRVCGKAFFDSLTLKKHRVTVHGEQRFPKESSRDNNRSNKLLGKDKVLVSSSSYSGSSCNLLPPPIAANNMQVSSNITVHSDSVGAGLLNSGVAGATIDSIIDETDGGGGDDDDDEDPLSSFGTTVVQIADPVPLGGTVTNGGTDATPTLVLSQPGMPTKTYRLAGECQNHQNHVLTFLEGSTNQWQTWCFCNPQNLPNTSTNNSNIVSSGVHSDALNNNNNGQNDQYFAVAQNQQHSTFNVQQSSNTATNAVNGIETNCNLSNLQNTLSNGNYDHQNHQQHYGYSDQYGSQAMNDDQTPVYTFTTDDNYIEISPDNEMQGLHSRSSGTSMMSDQMAGQQLERMDIKPQVQSFVPQTSTSAIGNQPSQMDTSDRKPVICSDAGDGSGLQYSLTVNNPATGNIQVTCDQFTPEFDSEVVTTSQGKKSKVYKCSICFRPFLRRIHLVTHMRRHTKEKPFKCKICFASFTHSNTLTAHLRSHTGEKPYKCSKCTSSFAQKSNLTAHERIHSGEKPYRCEVCFMGFRQASHLPTHMRTHSNERPYHCTECDKRFTQKSALKRHMKTHSRTSTQMMPCSVCGCQVAAEVYKEHVASHDTEVRECPVAGCGQLFKKQDVFEMHIKNDHNDHQNRMTEEAEVAAEEVGETNQIETGEIELTTDRDSTKIEIATFKVTKSSIEKPKVQNNGESITKRAGRRKGKQKRAKKPTAFKKEPVKSKPVIDCSSEQKPSTSSFRTSLRIKEAACKKKSSQVVDFITGDLPNFDEQQYMEHLANSVVDEPENGSERGKPKGRRQHAPSSAESDMGAWCFCEVPHASDQPHTSVQVPNNSGQTSAKPSDQTVVYQQPSIPSISVSERGPFSSPAESAVPVTLRSDTSIQLAHDGTAEIFAFIDNKGQFGKASSGHILATKEMTAVSELLTMGQTNNTSCTNSIQIPGQPIDHSNLLAQHSQNISGTPCYVSSKDINQSLLTSDGTVIQSEINMNTLSAPGQRRVHGSIHSVQTSAANNNQQVIPQTNSVSSSSGSAPFDSLSSVGHVGPGGSCSSAASNSPTASEARVQIVGTVTQDGKMQLFNNDGQMQVIDAVASSPDQMYGSLSTGQVSHPGNSEMLINSEHATSSSTTAISGGYVVSNPGSSHHTGQRHIQVLSGPSIEAVPTSRQGTLADGGAVTTINTPSVTTTGSSSSTGDGSSVEVLLLNDKTQHNQTVGQDSSSSLFLQTAMVMQVQDNVFYNTTDGQMLQISGGSREMSALNIAGPAPVCSESGIGDTVTYSIQGSGQVALQPSTTSTTAVTGGVLVRTPHEGLPMQNIITTANSLPMAQSSALQSSHAGFMNYACQMCDKCFSHYREFINHVKTKHTNRHMCPVCYKVFDKAADLTAHTQESHPKSNALSVAAVTPTITTTTCPDCGLDLTTKAKLTKHLRDVHKRGSRSATIPPRSRRGKNKPVEKVELSQPDDIKPLYDGEDDHSEEATQESLGTAADGQLGATSGKSKNKWSCNYCSETFGSHCDLMRHKLQHTGEKPYKCSWCDASFTRKSSLNNHSRIHTGIRPYSCTTCSESFSYRYQYNRHRSTHDTEASA